MTFATFDRGSAVEQLVQTLFLEKEKLIKWITPHFLYVKYQTELRSERVIMF